MVCWARYTTAKPPSPTKRSMRYFSAMMEPTILRGSRVVMGNSRSSFRLSRIAGFGQQIGCSGRAGRAFPEQCPALGQVGQELRGTRQQLIVERESGAFGGPEQRFLQAEPLSQQVHEQRQREWAKLEVTHFVLRTAVNQERYRAVLGRHSAGLVFRQAVDGPLVMHQPHGIDEFDPAIEREFCLNVAL